MPKSNNQDNNALKETLRAKECFIKRLEKINSPIEEFTNCYLRQTSLLENFSICNRTEPRASEEYFLSCETGRTDEVFSSMLMGKLVHSFFQFQSQFKRRCCPFVRPDFSLRSNLIVVTIFIRCGVVSIKFSSWQLAR